MPYDNYINVPLTPQSGVKVGAPATEQAVSVTDIICEGPIHGLVHGNGSVYFNDAPIQSTGNNEFRPLVVSNTSGRLTFSGTTGTVSSDTVIPDGLLVDSASPRYVSLNNYESATANITLSINSSGLIVATRSSGTFDASWTTNNLDGSVVLSSDEGIWKGAFSYATSTTGLLFLEQNDPAGLGIDLTKTYTIKLSRQFQIASITSTTVVTTSAPAAGTYDFIILAQPQVDASAGTSTDILKKYEEANVDFRDGSVYQDPILPARGIGGSLSVAGSTAGVNLPELKQLTSSAASSAGLSAHMSPTTQYPDGQSNSVDGANSPTFLDPADFGLDTQTKINEVDLVQFSIRYGALVVTKADDGKKVAATARYKMEIQTTLDGVTSSWNNMFPSKGAIIEHTGKRTAPLDWQHQVSLEAFRPFDTFRIRVARLTRHVGGGVVAGGLNYKDEAKKSQLSAAAAIVNPGATFLDKFNYPCTAHAQTVFSSKQLSNVPKISYELRGLKVQIPTTYVPREYTAKGVEAQYTGFWDGTLTTALYYTDNPAWIFYDIITNRRYGAGEWVFPSDIDIYSLYRVARYCDELVQDGKVFASSAAEKNKAYIIKELGTSDFTSIGAASNTVGESFVATGAGTGSGKLHGAEPRFRMNLFLTKATDVYKVLKDMASMFTGMIYWMDGQLQTIIDAPSDPVYNFTKGNVIDGQFQYETSGLKTRVNQCVVTWNNPENNYKPTALIVEDREAIIRMGKIVSQNAVAFGATSEGQALRFGKWKLFTAQNQVEITNFQTAMGGGFLRPGDIVNIQDADRAGARFSGRVSKSLNPTTGLTLNHTLTAAAIPTLSSNGHGNAEKSQNCLWQARVQLPSSFSSDCILFEHGGTGNGIYLGMEERSDGYNILLRLSDGSSSLQDSGADRVYITIPISKIPQFDDGIHDITWDVNLSTGRARLWIDNILYADETTSSGGFHGDEWAGSDEGSFGVAGVGSMPGAESNVAWPGTVETLKVYNNQVATGTYVSGLNTITFDAPVAFNASSTYELNTLVTDNAAFYTGVQPVTVNGTTYNQSDKIPQAYIYESGSYVLRSLNTEARASNAFVDSSGSQLLPINWKPYTYVETNSLTNPGSSSSTATIASSGSFDVVPAPETIWSLTEVQDGLNTTGSQKLYKILSLKEADDGLYSITAVEHYNEKYSAVDKDYELSQVPDTIFADEPTDIPAPLNLYSSLLLDKKNPGQHLRIDWDAPDSAFIAGYEIHHNIMDPTLDSVIHINNNTTEFLFENLEGGEYIIRVRTVSTSGNYSDFKSTTYIYDDIFDENIVRMPLGIPKGAISTAQGTLSTTSPITYSFPADARMASLADPFNPVILSSVSQDVSQVPADIDHYLLLDHSVPDVILVRLDDSTFNNTPFYRDAGDGSATIASSMTSIGTVSIGANSSTLTGSGTSFLSTVKQGDVINLSGSNSPTSGDSAIVTAIANDTSLTLDRGFSTAKSSITGYRAGLRLDPEKDTIFARVLKTGSTITLENFISTNYEFDGTSLTVDSSGTISIPDGGVDTDQLAANAVTTAEIESQAITSALLEATLAATISSTAVQVESLSAALGSAESAASAANAASIAAAAALVSQLAASTYNTAVASAANSVSATRVLTESAATSASIFAAAAAASASIAEISKNTASADKVAASAFAASASAFATASEAAKNSASGHVVTASSFATSASDDATAAASSASSSLASASTATVQAAAAASSSTLSANSRSAVDVAKIEAEMVLANLMPSVVKAPTTSWADDPYIASGGLNSDNTVLNDQSFHGSFVTNDATFGEAYVFTAGENRSFGPSQLLPFDDNKVYRLTVQHRVSTDNSQGSPNTRFTLGFTEYTDGTADTSNDNVQPLTIDRTSAQGAQTSILYVSRRDLSGVTGYVQSGTNNEWWNQNAQSNNTQIGFQVRNLTSTFHGGSSSQNGASAVHEMLVEDVTALIDAIQQADDAATSAAASLSSSQAASASRSSASASATAAESSRQSASTQAASAANSSSSAVAAKETASSSAAAAVASATLSATAKDNSVSAAGASANSASAALSSSQAASASRSSASASATAAESSRQSASTQAANAANSSSSAVAAKETASSAAADAASSATLSASVRDSIVSQNLVGDSEVTIDGLLNITGEGWATNFWERSNTQAKNGTYSAKAKTAMFADQFAEIYDTNIPMVAGDKFTWSAWVYKDFSQNITLQFQQFGGWAEDTVNTTNAWQFVTGTGTVASGSGVGTPLILDVRGHNSLSSGGIFVDNLTIVRGDQDLSTILTDDSATTNRLLGVNSESSAALSADASLSSSQAAAASKSSASASATAAESSRQSASTQAANAANSSSSAVSAKETASSAAANAASSATLSATAKDNSVSAADASANSASAALSSSQAASASRSSASASATAAESSRQSASTQAANAANSSSSATVAKETASSSAAGAASSATLSATAKDNSVSAAGASANSASAALSSSQAASASRSSASASATAAESSRQSASTQAANAANSSSSAVVAKETASSSAAGAASSATLSAAARGQSLLDSQGIANAGFEFGETGVDSVPAGWEAEGQRSDFPNDTGFYTSPVNTNSNYGSTKAYGSNDANAASGHWIRLSKYFLAEASQTFTASLDVYLADTIANGNNRDPEWIDEDDVFKIYNWYDADGALLSQTAVSSATSQYNQDNSSWVNGSSKAPMDTWFNYTSSTVTAPANTSYVRIDLILIDDQNGNVGDDVLVDYATWAAGGNFRGYIDDFVLTSSGGVVEINKGNIDVVLSAAASLSSAQAASASRSSASASATAAQVSRLAASTAQTAAEAAETASVSAKNTASSAAASASQSESLTSTAVVEARTEVAAIGEYLFVNPETWVHTPQSYGLGTPDKRFIGNSPNMTGTHATFFVTNDTEFGNAYLPTKALNDSISLRRVFTYASDKVWLLKAKMRTVDDGDTIGTGVYSTLGINGWTTDGTRITSDPDLNNVQYFAWTDTVSDGVQEHAHVFAGSDYTDADLEALPGIIAQTQNSPSGGWGRVVVVSTGTNTPAFIGFQIRHNASGVTDGQSAIGSFEIIDITESVKAEIEGVAAADSASSAVTSAASASSQSTAAGNSASAANASKLSASAAETAAELAETNAVAAKNTASSAAASASSSKVLAASSATTADNSASAAEAARDSMVLHNYAYNGDAAKDQLPAYFQSSAWETTTAQAKVGTRSFRLTSSGLATSNPDIFHSPSAVDFPAIATGDKFTWGAWVYVDGSDTGSIAIGFAGDGGWGTSSTSLRNQWVFVTTTGTAGTYPVTNQLLRLELRETMSTGHPNDNSVYIDHLQVVAGEVDLTTVATSYGASQGSYEATLSASAANTSESNAATSASSASASAAASNSSALSAVASRDTASSAAVNSGNSASAANTSKETASASQTAAANSASAANSSRLAASASFTAASDSASSANSSRVAAGVSAGASNDSASSAAASASAAGASATASNSSRLAASSQATTAGNSASAALVSKQSASSFAANAASSAQAAIFDGKLLEARVTSGLNGHYADSDWFLCTLGSTAAPAYVVSFIDNVNIYAENMVSGTVYAVKLGASKYTNYNIPTESGQSGTGPWRVFSSGPIVCKHSDGYMGAPANFSGQFLGQYANRYYPVDIFLFSPQGKATVDVYFSETLTGFDENSSVHHTITIPDGGYYQWQQDVDASSSQTSGNTTYLFKSDVKISGIFKPEGGDYQLMVPLSNGEVVGNDYSNNGGYPYFNNNATNSTVTDVSADGGARYYVNDDENFWFMNSNTADGAGGDAEFAVPRQGLSDYYIWAEPNISNFRLTSVEPAEIVVMKADGTVLYNIDHSAASTTAPLFYQVGSASGSTNINAGGGPYRFVGTAPFHVVAQEGDDDDETTLLGARQANLDQGAGVIKAIAQQSLTLTSAVDSNVTTISAQATTINGLEGQYTVKIDNNNHVSGFGLASTNTNGTPTSAFIIRADRFAVVDPASGGSLTTTPDTADIPFEIVNGVTKIKNANVGSLSAGNIAANAIRSSELQISADTDSQSSSMFFDGANNSIKIYDSSGNIRVRIGALS